MARNAMEDDERIAVVLAEYVCGDKAVGSVVERLWQRLFHDLALAIDKYIGIVSLSFMIVLYGVARCPSVLLHMVYCK